MKVVKTIASSGDTEIDFTQCLASEIGLGLVNLSCSAVVSINSPGTGIRVLDTDSVSYVVGATGSDGPYHTSLIIYKLN